MRVNKMLSNLGYCSRKEANRWIEDGRLTINGELCKPGQWTWENEEILLDGKPLVQQPLRYVLMNKPVGITCTAESSVQGNIIAFLNFEQFLFPVGRLDKESQGLILLTNDGALANEVMEADYEHEKEYHVWVNQPITESFLTNMASGMMLGTKVVKPCKVRSLGEQSFEIILSQGLNRQIRKMCTALGYRVEKLERVRIMNLKLGDLPIGMSRELTFEELETLRRLTQYDRQARIRDEGEDIES